MKAVRAHFFISRQFFGDNFVKGGCVEHEKIFVLKHDNVSGGRGGDHYLCLNFLNYTHAL